MDYRTGWNDAIYTAVLALLHYKQELITQHSAAPGGVPQQFIDGMKEVLDGAIGLLAELEPKDAE